MTTIKLNQDLEIKGCSTCPFVDYEDEIDFGELTDNYTCYCKLLNINSWKDIQVEGHSGYHEPREDKPDICPIIEIKIE